MTFFEKNEENLEALIFALTDREKSTIAIGIIDSDETCEKAIAYITSAFKKKQTYFFDFFGQKISSLLAFFRGHLSNIQEELPIVHITRIDPLLFTSIDHKVISSPLVAQLNMERELLFREVKGLIILWISRAGYNRLRMDAPDFMDWVVASFVFENEDDVQSNRFSFEIPLQTIEEKGKAETIELRQKANKLLKRTSKFERNKSKSIRDKKEYFNLLLGLIQLYIDLKDFEKAENMLEKAYILAKDNNLAQGFEFGKLLGDWGDIESSLGNLDKALLLFEEALNHFELLGDRYNISICLRRLGRTYDSIGDLNKAMQFFEDGLKVTKDLHERYQNVVIYKEQLSVSYGELGEIYISLGNIEKALKYYDESLLLSKELYRSNENVLNVKNGLALSYSKLGEIYTLLGNLNKALYYFEERLKLGEELYKSNPNHDGYKRVLAISYSKLGEIHTSVGDLNEALQYYNKALLLGK